MKRSEMITEAFTHYSEIERPKKGTVVMKVFEPDIYVFRSSDMFCGVATTEPLTKGSKILCMPEGRRLYVLIEIHEQKLN